jgi:dipeptidase D
MSSPLENLEPKLLWTAFDMIRQVPRPSKHEERISEAMDRWASDRGFDVKTDAAGNMVVRVPATPGHEDAPTVILQGHLDMVCEKNSDVEHDFMAEGIIVEVDGDWVVAKGTTLGADNGVGVAAAMAIAEDGDAVHGPLEILCTVDEETGLTGAKQLDGSMLAGRIMINLDTEEDGEIYIGCAGGADIHTRLPLARRRGLLSTVPIQLSVRGLTGGHSGMDIILNRGNAIKFAARTLLAALEARIEVDLVSFDGGSKHNAIPREAFVKCRLHREDVDRLREVAQSCIKDFREEFEATDPEMAIEIETLEDSEELQSVVNVHARDRLLHLVDGLPHGVLSMSRDVPGLVETSNNLAVITTEADHAMINTSQRSSVMPALHAVGRQITSISRQSGATVSVEDPYPGWKPNPESPIVKKTAEVYGRVFGSEPHLKAIHAGLECGLLIEKIPGMDVVSIGPEIQGAHSPDERVQISSVERFYGALKELLAELSS